MALTVRMGTGAGGKELGWSLRQEVDDASLTKVFLPAAAVKTPLLQCRPTERMTVKTLKFLGVLACSLYCGGNQLFLVSV